MAFINLFSIISCQFLITNFGSFSTHLIGKDNAPEYLKLEVVAILIAISIMGLIEDILEE